jgi:hypothetical protein
VRVGDHLAEERVQVPTVPLPEAKLPLGARLPLEQIVHELELRGAPDRGGVPGQLLEQAVGHVLGGHLLAPPEVDQTALHPAKRGAHLVVVDQLGGVLDQRLARVVQLVDPVREGGGQGGEANGVLEGRLLIEDPGLDRAEVRVRAHVPPHVGVVLDRTAPHHLLDAVRVDLPGAVVRRDPDPGEGAEDRRARRHHPRPLAAPERRVGRQRQQQRQVRAQAVGHVDRDLGIANGDVHVQREGRLALDEVAQRPAQQLVARAARDARLLPLGQRVRAGHARAQAQRLELGGQPRAQHFQLGRHRARATVRACRQLERAGVRLGAHAGRQLGREGREDVVDRLRQPPPVGVEQHDLLLGADAPFGEQRLRRPTGPLGPERRWRVARV